MDFPQWQAFLTAHGLFAGLDAAIHAFLGHGIATGVFFCLVLTGRAGSLRGDPRWERFAADAALATALGLGGCGVVAGAGIWLASGAAPPRPPAAMLRLYCWPWLLDWIACVAEAALLLAGCLAWRAVRRTKRRGLPAAFALLAVSAAGLVLAWLLAGPLGPPAEPGRWPLGQDLGQAFSDPGLWPRIFVRLFGGLALGASLVSGLLLWNRGRSSGTGPDFRTAALRLHGLGLLLSTAAAALAVRASCGSLPAHARADALFAALASHPAYARVFWATVATGLGLILLLALANLAGDRALARAVVVPALIAAFALTAGFERAREFLCAPGRLPDAVYAAQPADTHPAAGGTTAGGRHLFWPAVRPVQDSRPIEAASR
uniref:Uncharacterized protein n=1 Tax=Desulfovibrio sp. U5L TaxID=596152 RepID=I2Q4J9_9BACT